MNGGVESEQDGIVASHLLAGCIWKYLLLGPSFTICNGG